MSESRSRQQRVDALLAAALERPATDRAAFLSAECGGDEKLRGEVEELLRLGEATGDFLRPGGGVEGPLVEELESRPGAPPQPLTEGSRVGAYRVIREIGRGGMAVVYLAERADGHFEQRVALKVIQSLLAGPALADRFRQERQILASLNHPNIARLLDGGVTPDGQPFLAMEHVEGLPIDRYCDEKRLTLPGRLRLLQTAARAIQYAHRNLVVHRDIKPSNILVTAAGDVKLLDFGIAKVLDPDLGGAPRTQTHLQMMTPEYASPEQVRRGPISTASDVYQLGMLAYVLLTGRLPYDLSGLAPTSAERVVCDVEPPRPSAVEVPAAGAAARGTTPAGLRRALQGDLDAIVMTALRKEPERRYASADHLVDDIDRHLSGTPISARGDDLAYRATRFLRRHRVGAAVAGLFLLVLVGYAATVTVQSGTIARERDRAREQQEAAEEVTEFLVDVFDRSDPAAEELTARQILDEGAGRVSAELTDRPEIRSRLLHAIGHIYWKLGHYPESRKMLEEALEIRRLLGEDASPELAENLEDLSRLLRDLDEHADAEAMQREALAIRQELFGTPHADTAASMGHLGMLLLETGRAEEAEEWLRRSLDLHRELHGDRHEDVATGLNNLGRVLRYRGEYEAAETALREALEMRGDLLGEDHNDTVTTLSNLGVALQAQGEHTEAVEIFRKVAEFKREVLGEDHPYFAIHLSNLAGAMQLSGDPEASVPILEEALEIRRRMLGSDAPEYAANLNDLGRAFHDQGKLDEARRLYEDALRIYRARGGHPWMGATIYNLSEVFEAQGEFERARTLAEESLRLDRNGLGDDHPSVGLSLMQVARLARKQGDLEGAEREYRQALEIFRTKLPERHRWVGTGQLGLAEVLRDAGRYDEARTSLQEALSIRAEVYGPDHQHTEAVRAVLVTLPAPAPGP